MRADWVYRPDFFDELGALIDDNGSYSRGDKTLAPGDVNANALILYDSFNFVSKSNLLTSNLGTIQPAWTRAEGSRAKIIAVEGTMIVRPSTWALGSTFMLGMRFGIFEQDVGTSAFLIDPTYALWTNPAAMALSPARWANDRNWQREFRRQEAFATNDVRWQFYFRFRVNRRLKPNECYAAYVATDGTSVTLVYNAWFRTLVADEG